MFHVEAVDGRMMHHSARLSETGASQRAADPVPIEAASVRYKRFENRLFLAL